MPVFRIEKNRNYTVMSNYHLRDINLSLKAKGLLCFILSFATLVSFINAMEVREDDENFKNNVDLAFEELEAREPDHFAVRQYKKYKLAAGVI